MCIALPVVAMGCVQSVNKPKSFADNIAVLKVNCTIDSNPTTIDESSNVILRYRTPHFRASALVMAPPVARNETWTVGWVQACNHMDFRNTYGSAGVSSWELPALRDGLVQAISDSDGVNYPWYGDTTETVTLVGPTKRETRLAVTMDDNFYPSVTWSVPVCAGGPAPPQLSAIDRDQRFTTWLAAVNHSTGETALLRTVRWRMKLRIEVDPARPLGERAWLVEPLEQEQPQVLPRNERIPPNAMVKPNANDAQELIWWPADGAPIVVIPPKYEAP